MLASKCVECCPEHFQMQAATAKANGQASAMVAATMSKAKLLGLDKGDGDKNSEVMPVKIVIQTVDACKPERVS